ncbi:MAG: helix-turn-helix domain-containing protein [Streptosporangiaceae bacterium]|nr:helix-turn-helix domain-containing protein [Streptosporangiaceae bacterium]
MNGTPAVRHRLVGAALRRYREHRGFRLEDAATVLECDRSKISRIETGQRGVRNRDLRDLLNEYGIGEHEQAILVVLANPKRVRGWWADYEDVLTADQRDLAIMESLAARTFAYHSQQIPALLQTEEYARAVTSASRLPLGQRAVEAMLARQQSILGKNELELTVIIGESALRQQVGGADVMQVQLTHLADVCENNTGVNLQVQPFASTAPALDLGGLTILTFAPDLGIVHLSGISGAIYLADPYEVACYKAAFTQIRNASISVPDSAAMLRRLAAGATGSDRAA